MTDRETMQQALEALELYVDYEWATSSADKAITALRERLAQPEQELVCVCGAIWEGQELVSTPRPRQWQGLTDEEIESMMDYWSEDARSAYGGAHAANGEYVHIPDIIRDAEARLKEKNNG